MTSSIPEKEGDSCGSRSGHRLSCAVYVFDAGDTCAGHRIGARKKAAGAR